MKKKRYIILTALLFLLNIQPTSAACTQEEINSFKRIEDDYTVKYEYDKSTQKYNLYFNRSKPNMYDYTIYTDDEFECKDIDDNTTKCSYFQSGEYQLVIVGQTNTCNDVLKKTTLKLPKYNKFSEDPLCEGIEDFVLCNPAYEKELDYETFVSRVETYKKNHVSIKQDEELSKDEETQKNNERINVIINYIKEYWIEITVIAVFIILVLITIILTAKSMRKSRYLE